MAEQREAIYKLKFMVDQAGQQQSIRAIDALAKEFVDVDQNAQRVGKAAQTALAKVLAFEEGRHELRSLAEEAKNVAIGSDAIGDAFNRGIDKLRATADEAKEATAYVEDLGQEMDTTAQKIEKATDASDDLGKSLKKASDIPNLTINRNLSSVRGIAQSAGLGGVAQPLGVAGDVLELAEELPNLKTALQDLPDAARIAVSEIGATGFGLIGALGGLAIAFKLASDAAEHERNRKLAELKAADQYSQFEATATFDEATTRREALKTEIERQQALLANVQAQLDQVSASASEAATKNFGDNVAADFIGKMGTAIRMGAADLGVGRGDIQALKSEAERLNAELTNNIEFYNLLADGLNRGAFAANDAQLAIEQQAQKTVDFYQKQYNLQIQYQDLATSGSEEQLQQAIDQNKALADANRERIKGLYTEMEVLKQAGKEIPSNLQASFDDAIKESFELSAAQVYLTDTIKPLIEVREKETDLIETTTTAIEAANNRIKDAAVINERISAERIAQIKEQAQSELEFNRFLKTATADSVAARIEALQEEAVALRSILPELERMAPTSQAAADEFKATTDKLAEINDELARLGSGGILAAIQHEQAQLTEEITKIEAAKNEKIAQLTEQAAHKQAELYADLQQELADAAVDANEKRADAQRDYEEESADIARDLAKKRLDIEKKYSRDAANAVGDRDALALYQAKQTRDDQLDDAETAAAEQQAELQRNYAQQLETIARELEKQRQTLNAKYQQQLNDLQQQTQNSINLERQKAAQEIAARQQAYQEELAQLNGFAVSGTTSIAAFATNSLTTLSAFVSQAQSIMAGLMGSGTTTTSPSVPPITNRPPGAPGGPQPAPTLNINIAGYTIPVIQQQINDVLSNLFP